MTVQSGPGIVAPVVRDRGGVAVAAASVAALAVVSAFGVGYAVGRPAAADLSASAARSYAAGRTYTAPQTDVPISYKLGEAPCQPAPQSPDDPMAPASPDETAGCTDSGQEFTLYLDRPWVVDQVGFRPDLVLDGRRVLRVRWSFGPRRVSLAQDIREFGDAPDSVARVPLPGPGMVTSCVSVVVDDSVPMTEPEKGYSPRPNRFELVGHPAAGLPDRTRCDL
jgi:hypothetical protein